MQTINSAKEWKAALKSGPRVVIDCFGEGCGPCKKIAPKIAELAKTCKNVRFYKCDVYSEDMDDQATQYGVTSVPTFLYFHNGCWLNDLTIIGDDLPGVRSSLETLLKM